MSDLFLVSELSAKLGVSDAQILEWEKGKLIKAAGFTETKDPYFSASVIKDCGTIINLTKLGYPLPAIYKIIKKVGLPNSKAAKELKTKGKYLTIGELADRIAVSPRTIKHWEDKGIIESDMRSEGGFRLFLENYVFFCSLILDLQNFGYTLDEIKVISDYFRDFLEFQSDVYKYDPEFVTQKLNLMTQEIDRLFNTTKKLLEGIDRWKGLLKSKEKEIKVLKTKNSRRNA